MKRITVFIVLFLAILADVSAQETETGIKKEERNTHQDHLLVDFGYETFTSRPGFTDFEWYNNGLNIQLFYDQLFGQTGISGAIGVGFSTQSYYSNKQIRRDTTASFLYSDWVETEKPYDKNKVSTSFIEVPVELRFRSKIDDWGYRWKFAVGGKVGFLIDTHDKLVDKNGVKYKTYYFPDINRVRLALVARAGYGKVNFSFSYSFTDFFIPGRGQEMRQIGFGISLVPF